MSDGTVIPVYVKRLHKHNAETVLQESRDMMEYFRNKLIAMAACSGETVDGTTWHDHVAMEVPQMLEEYGENVFQAAMAQRIIDDPDECDDELDEGRTMNRFECPNCGSDKLMQSPVDPLRLICCWCDPNRLDPMNLSKEETK